MATILNFATHWYYRSLVSLDISREAIGSSENFTTAPDSSPDPKVPGLAPADGAIKLVIFISKFYDRRCESLPCACNKISICNQIGDECN